MNQTTLGRFKKSTRVEHSRQRIHWFWVVGPDGAAATWFSDHTRKSLGRSVCSPVVLHAAEPWSDAERHEPCELLESDCWWREVPDVTNLDAAARMFDAGDEAGVWAWLEGEYEGLAR